MSINPVHNNTLHLTLIILHEFSHLFKKSPFFGCIVRKNSLVHWSTYIEMYENCYIFCLLIYINKCSIKLYNLLFYRVCNVHGVKNAYTYMEFFILFLEILGFE